MKREKLDAGCQQLDAGCQKLDAGCQQLDAGCQKLDAGCQKLDVRSLMLNAKKHLPSSIQHPAFSAPTKNDVLIGPEYAVWSPGQHPLVENGINYYYDDVPTDGGYNHFELRRHKRAYSLPNPSGGYYFQQGDVAPPMGQAGAWIRDEIFGGS